MLRKVFLCLVLLAAACGGGARRVNPDLRAGPRHGEPPQGFEFTCTFRPGKHETPASAKRLCAARRDERVSARRTDDGGLRIRIRFRDVRRYRLDLYLYRQGRRTYRGAMLVEGRGANRIEIEPDRGWIAVERLNVRRRAAAGRYALTFGGVRVGGSFSVNVPREEPSQQAAPTLLPPPAPRPGEEPAPEGTPPQSPQQPPEQSPQQPPEPSPQQPPEQSPQQAPES